MDPLLVQLADSVAGARTLEQLVRPLLQMLHEITGLESTYLTTVDEQADSQHVLYSRNAAGLSIPEGLTVAWQGGLCRRALQEGRQYADDVGTRWADSDAARKLGINTYLSTAVRTQSGGLYGTLCAASTSTVALAPDALRLLDMFSQLIAQHVEREMLVEQLRKANAELAALALTDALTGLPNRRSLMLELSRMLARAERDEATTLVGFIDLDGFKEINDNRGHDIGDQLLTALAARLVGELRDGDLVARFGGDEFVVVAAASADAGGADALRERLALRTGGEFSLPGGAIDYPGASVGVVAIGPGGATAESALVRADAAMYEVKRARRPGRPQASARC